MERIFQNCDMIMRLENWEKSVHKNLDQKKFERDKNL